MTELDRAQKALKAAHEAGDTESAQKLAGFLKAQMAAQGTGPDMFPGQQPMGSQPGPREVAENRAVEAGAISQQLGAPFDSDQGITDPRQRFSLARQSSPESRANVLEKQFPGADVQIVDTERGRAPVFRPEGEESFRGINPRGVDVGDAGTVAGYVFNLENLTALGATIASRGLSWPWRMASVGGAAGAGRLADEGIDVARGANVDPLEDIFGRAAMSTVFGGAGEGAGSVVSRLINIPRGGGFIRPTEGVREAARAAGEEGLPPLTLGQTHPLFQRREAQAAMTGQVAPDVQARQRLAAREGLESARGQAPLMTDQQLDETVQTLARELFDGIQNPRVALREGGRALQRGREAFSTSSSAWRSRKYDRAMEHLGERSDRLTWNLDRVNAAADEVTSGVMARGRGGADVRVSREAGGEIGDVVRILKEMDPNQTGREGYDSLIELRRRLFNIKEQDFDAATPQQRDEIRAAGRLYGELTSAIDNPTLFGAPDETFSRLWGAATRANRWRESVLGADDVRKLAQSENPADLAAQFAAPGETTTLRLFKRIMPQQEWRAFQNSFETRLLAEPERIPTVLNSFRKDPDALDLLIPKAKQAELMTLGNSARKLQSFETALRAQDDFGNRAMMMLDEGRSRELEVMLREAGANSRFARDMRAGVVQKILDRATVFDRTIGQEVLNPQEAVRSIGEALGRNDLRKVLTNRDVRMLENYRVYLSRLGDSGDVGAGIAGAEVAGQSLDLLNPTRAQAGWYKVAQNALLARSFTSPRVQRFLTGGGKDLKPITSVRGTATLLSLIASDMERREGDRPLEDD